MKLWVLLWVLLQVVHDANGTTVSELTYVDVNTPQVGHAMCCGAVLATISGPSARAPWQKRRPKTIHYGRRHGCTELQGWCTQPAFICKLASKQAGSAGCATLQQCTARQLWACRMQ